MKKIYKANLYMLRQTKYRNPIDTSSKNPLYAKYWEGQNKLHNELSTQSYNLHKQDISPLDKFVKERDAELRRLADKRNNPGFWKELGGGFKQTFNDIYKPFNKWVMPIIGKIGGEEGKAMEKASNTYVGIVDKI